MSLKNKRLLVIGANGNICNAVIKAKSLGIYTVVVDYFADSPAKKFADKSYLISTADTDRLVDLCKEEKIDGVFTGYSELNLEFTRRLCERLNLPFYATEEHIKSLTNKAFFKEACKKHGVTSVPSYNISEDFNEEDLKQVDFPVIVKPVDSYSGKGITICQSKEQLNEAIKKAIETSSSKKFLVEKFMSEEEFDIFTVYYTIQDGRAALNGITDRYMFDFENNRRLSTALLFPSEYLPRYLAEMDEKVIRMLKGLGIENGTIFIEGAVNKEGFYFWECGYRLCGAQQGIIPAAVNGVDVEEMLIHHALTGKMGDEDMTHLEDAGLKGKIACNLLLFSNPCTIKDFRGFDKIKRKKQVINITKLYLAGDSIQEKDIGTLNQSFARVHLVCDTNEEMARIIEEIFNTVEIIDDNGENKLIKTFSVDYLFKKRTRFS